MDDAPLWPRSDLLALCQHPHPRARAWALGRLTHEPATDALPAVLVALEDADDLVVVRALDCLERQMDSPLRDDVRAALRRVARAGRSEGNRDRAVELLAARGDEEGVAALCARLRADPDSTAWAVLAEGAPERGRELLRALDVPAGRDVSFDRLVGFARLTADDELGAGLLAADRLRERRRLGLMSLLWRAGVEHLVLEGDDGRLAAAMLERRRALWTRVTANAAIVFAAVHYRDLLQALRQGQHRRAISEGGAWAERLHRDHPESRASRSLFQALRALRAPDAVHTTVAFALAVGATERSLATDEAVAASPPAVHAELLVSGPRARWDAWCHSLGERVRRDGAARDEVAGVLADMFDGGDAQRHATALDLACAVPELPLPASALWVDPEAFDEAVDTQVRCLVARPAWLRARASECLGGDATPLLCEALEKTNRRWAGALLLERLDALLRSDDDAHVVDALLALGDPAAIDPLVAAWRPGQRMFSVAVVELARLAGRLEALPVALRREGEETEQRSREFVRSVLGDHAAATAGALDGPLEVTLRCNRCGRSWGQDMGSAIVHPNREVCRRDGWDGVCFSRVAVCAYCGSVDDYALTRGAELALMSRTLLGQRAKVTLGVPALVDGTRARRPSEVERRWRARVAAHPEDGEAWLRLGNALNHQERHDEAVAAWRTAIPLRPGRYDAMALVIDALHAAGRHAEIGDLLGRALAAMAGDRLESEDFRADAATAFCNVWRAAIARGEAPALAARWTEVAGGRAAGEASGTLDLRAVTNWEGLARFLAHPQVTALSLVPAEGATRDGPLAAIVERDGGLDQVVGQHLIASPQVRATPRVGRNDPCPCGSGKKYKKCHGA